MKKIAIIGTGPSGLTFALRTLIEINNQGLNKDSVSVRLYGNRSSYTRTQVIRLTLDEWTTLNDALNGLEASDQQPIWDELKANITRSPDSSVHIKLRDLEVFLKSLVEAYAKKNQGCLEIVEGNVQSIQENDEGFELTVEHGDDVHQSTAHCVVDARGRQQSLHPAQQWRSYVKSDVKQRLYPWQCAVTYDLHQAPQLQSQLKQMVSENFFLDGRLTRDSLPVLKAKGWLGEDGRLPRVRLFNINDKLYMGQDCPESLYRKLEKSKQAVEKNPHDLDTRTAYVSAIKEMQEWSQLLLKETGFEALQVKELSEGDSDNLVVDLSLFKLEDLKFCENPLVTHSQNKACLLVGGDALIQPHYQTSAGVNLAIRQADDYGHLIQDFLKNGVTEANTDRLTKLQRQRILEYAARVNFFLQYNRLPQPTEGLVPDNQLFEQEERPVKSKSTDSPSRPSSPESVIDNPYGQSYDSGHLRQSRVSPAAQPSSKSNRPIPTRRSGLKQAVAKLASLCKTLINGCYRVVSWFFMFCFFVVTRPMVWPLNVAKILVNLIKPNAFSIKPRTSNQKSSIASEFKRGPVPVSASKSRVGSVANSARTVATALTAMGVFMLTYYFKGQSTSSILKP